MKFDMTAFYIANTLPPAFTSLLLGNLHLPMIVGNLVVFAFCGALLAVNIAIYKDNPGHRRVVGAVMALNLVALIFLGDISFITVIPVLINYLPGGPFY